jgi:hypothetical protein
MRTTLELFCYAMGWQGGTIHQAKDRFAVSDLKTMDRVCGFLADNSSKISDPDCALWFMVHRNKAIRLNDRALAVRS